MDIQKTIIKVLELFKTLAILYGLSWVIFAATAFYYINQDKPSQQSSAPSTVNTSENTSTELSESAIKGMTLFKSNCAQCHSVSSEMIVGPGLQGLLERRKVKWVRDWIRNPRKVLDSGDKYANELFEKFNRTEMTAFPNFTDEDIAAILKYIKENNQLVAVP